MSLYTDFLGAFRRPMPRTTWQKVAIAIVLFLAVAVVVLRQPLIRSAIDNLLNPAPVFPVVPAVPVIVPSNPSVTPMVIPTWTPTVTVTATPTPTATVTPTVTPTPTAIFPFPSWEQIMGRRGEAARNCAPLPGGDTFEALDWLATQAGYPETIYGRRGLWYGAVPSGAPEYCTVLVLVREPMTGEGRPMGEIWGNWAFPVSVVYYAGATRGVVIYNYVPAP